MGDIFHLTLLFKLQKLPSSKAHSLHPTTFHETKIFLKI